MKYVELYIKSLKSKQVQPQQAAPATMNYDDLPGLKSYKQMDAEKKMMYKREYNLSLEQHRRMVTERDMSKGARLKELKQAIASGTEHRESMLLKIGTHTPSEKAMGFEVPSAE